MMLSPLYEITRDQVEKELQDVLARVSMEVQGMADVGEQYDYELNAAPWHVSLTPLMELGDQPTAISGVMFRVLFRMRGHVVHPGYGTSRFEFAAYNADFVLQHDEAGKVRWSAFGEPRGDELNNDELACWLIERLINSTQDYRSHYSCHGGSEC